MESTPSPAQATPGSSEQKYQKKSGKSDKKPRERGGNRNVKKDEKKSNTIFLNSIELSDYSTHAEAAEAISHALSTYASVSPENIRPTVINYLKKQIRAGVKVRNAILSSGKIENPSVLT